MSEIYPKDGEGKEMKKHYCPYISDALAECPLDKFGEVVNYENCPNNCPLLHQNLEQLISALFLSCCVPAVRNPEKFVRKYWEKRMEKLQKKEARRLRKQKLREMRK